MTASLVLNRNIVTLHPLSDIFYLFDETMDVEALHVTLQQSFSPDASLRSPAEERIRNLKHVKGSTVMLLQVASETQVCADVTSEHST